MFLSHMVLSVAELLRTLFSSRRHRGLIGGIVLTLVVSFILSANVRAKRSVSDSPFLFNPTAQSIPATDYSHFVKPVGVAVPFDVSTVPVTIVSAASFESVPVAPGSIVSAFGPSLTTQTASAVGTPLPTELGGTTVEVNGRKAGLFYVSPNQINYLMPAATEVNGPANVVVKAGSTISSGTVMVAQVAPGIFTANASGQGVPAASVLRVKINGSQSFEPLSQYNSFLQRYITKPIDMSTDTDRVFLVLFLTGIRQAADDNRDGNVNEGIRVLIGGNEITPFYAGIQPDFAGLDQINVEIPRSLIGRGHVNVSVTGLGYNSSNLAEIEIASPPGGPQVGTFNGPALAGELLTIIGSGFSPVKEENLVRISGRDAEVMSASATQLTVKVPFGVEAGTVSVRTTQGEGRSPSDLSVRTSVSGVVEDQLGQPLIGVSVSVMISATETRTATTTSDGSFVLADIPEGYQFFTVDGGTLNTTPPYPQKSLKINVVKNRDNQYPYTIALQQSTGGSGLVGGTGFTAGADGAALASATAAPVTIQTGDYQLQVPDGIKVTTPEGAKSARLVLTPLQNGRTPVGLPYGYYSSSIVQITPFNIKLDPGAKLTFPNTDKYPAGTPLTLFRYDDDAGKFIPEKATVTVSADGKRIETGDNDIKVSSYYFASIFRNTTTITGLVFESNGKPAQHALARFRGQESFTDGNGSYILRYVTVDEKSVSVEISTLRASTRVDRATTASAQAAIGGITKMPDVVLPGETTNRAPTIQVLPKVIVDEGQVVDIRIQIDDPDPGQTVTAVVTGAKFAKLIPPNPTSKSSAYSLHLEPQFSDAGDYTLKITATDNLGLSNNPDVGIVSVIVNDINRSPSAVSQSVTLDEDTSVAIKLTGTDPDGAELKYIITAMPANGALTGDAPAVTYKPNLNFNGTDRFTFIVNDGQNDSAPATVTITVKPVNDAPVLTVPAAQTVSEGQTLSLAVSATDPDNGQTLTITASGLPDGATFVAASPTSGQFRWTPSFTQSGNYTIKFTATDNGTPQLSDTRDLRITVTDVALLIVPGTQTVNEGLAISFDVSAAPGLLTPATITLSGKPDGADFPDAATNTAKFRWTPSTIQAGNYILTFKATINSPVPVSEMKQVQITVVDVVHELSKEGASFSVYGGAGQLLPPQSDDGDALGSSLATGDLNGDGVADLAIGAPGANGTGLNHGKVYVFFGRATLTGAVDVAQQKADVEILGDAANDRFGSSLAIGDLNGDGKNDLVIGAPLADAAANVDAGKVYVVFGGFTAGTSDSVAKLAGATILGSQRSERIGTSVAVAPVMGKNAPAADLIVGAPGFDSSDTTPVIDIGAVFVFSGGPTLTKTIDLLTATPAYAVTGTIPAGELGTTLAVGNFNGDNLADFAMGAPLANANGVKNSGVVYLVLGSASLSGMKNTSQAASLMLTGSADSDNLGAALAMGDLNGDGRADLVLAAPGVSGNGNARQKIGAVYVIYGVATVQNRPADLTFYGVGATNDGFPDALGKTLAVGDFNGDGIADLAIGAPGADSVDSKRDPIGTVYVVFGARTGLAGTYDLATKAADWIALGADPADNLGLGALAIANLNASDSADIILGIPRAKSVNNSRQDAGEVRVVFGTRR